MQSSTLGSYAYVELAQIRTKYGVPSRSLAVSSTAEGKNSLRQSSHVLSWAQERGLITGLECSEE